jgi:methylenetetrahydrofolate reductase (NADPH)
MSIPSTALQQLLQGYSTEVTSADRRSIDAAITTLPRGAEVYIASLPSDGKASQVRAATELYRAGLKPVPHIVARNIGTLKELDYTLQRLRNEAEVDRVLLLAGDREHPVGELQSSLQILESGLLNKNGISKVAFAAYPEAHPRISQRDLFAARHAKLTEARSAGLDAGFVTQFCFDAQSIISLAEGLRFEGIAAPLRVGVAGPASRTSLLRYALICGVGSSIRALKERPAARNIPTGETPTELLTDVANAQVANPTLKIDGVHFFTFASLDATVRFVNDCHRIEDIA